MSIGSLCLALALPLSIYNILISFFAKGGSKLIKKSRQATHLSTLLIGIASLMLVFAFISNNFDVEYVASYSSFLTPFIYKLTGIWAGLDGSLLFWVLLVAVFASLVAMTKKDDFFPYVNAFLGIITLFFLMMLVFAADPFRTLANPPMDGRGLNPLLQNIFMIFHPPALYLGYVGFSVPFAYALTSLVKKEHPDAKWLKEVRRWMLASWIFLTIGNALGAMWAYVELGWGGYWAWDPVENAGILPWFTATAFLHSVVIQQKHKMLNLWNLSLVILTFLLTIFGTFITRSGVIKSVHSFSDVTIGTYFIIFMIIVVIFSFGLVISRGKKLMGEGKLESVFSREGAFYINNLFLLLALFGIFWGTILPLVTELFTGQKLEVTAPFFNRVLTPVGIALLFLTALCPNLEWKKMKLIKRAFILPSIASVLTFLLAFLGGIKKPFPLAVALCAPFLIVTFITEFLKASRGGFSFIRYKPRKYGGHIVHLGIAILFIGIAGSHYQKEFSFSLNHGEKKVFDGYELEMGALNWVQHENKEGVIANVALKKSGKGMGVLKPALYLHQNQEKPIAEIDVKIKPLKDIYLALGGVSGKEETCDFKLTITPLISMVWLGSFLMILGAVIAILPKKEMEKAI